MERGGRLVVAQHLGTQLGGPFLKVRLLGRLRRCLSLRLCRHTAAARASSAASISSANIVT